MPRVTVDIQTYLHIDAKACAAKAGTTVSAIIRQLLEGYVRNVSAPLPGNFEVLFRYSLGQMPMETAIKELHLESEDALNFLTNQAGLPRPRLSLKETAAMQKHFGEMLDRFGDPEAVKPPASES